MVPLEQVKHRQFLLLQDKYMVLITRNKFLRQTRYSSRIRITLTEFQLNASDDRGIDVVREQIKQFAETRTLFSKTFKLIILDEADMMTQAAQAALRRVIEQYTKNVRFCIICNYVNKIAPAIQSRCTRFRFSPLPIPEVEKCVNTVVDAEK